MAPMTEAEQLEDLIDIARTMRLVEATRDTPEGHSLFLENLRHIMLRGIKEGSPEDVKVLEAQRIVLREETRAFGLGGVTPAESTQRLHAALQSATDAARAGRGPHHAADKDVKGMRGMQRTGEPSILTKEAAADMIKVMHLEWACKLVEALGIISEMRIRVSQFLGTARRCRAISNPGDWVLQVLRIFREAEWEEEELDVIELHTKQVFVPVVLGALWALETEATSPESIRRVVDIFLHEKANQLCQLEAVLDKKAGRFNLPTVLRAWSPEFEENAKKFLVWKAPKAK